MKVKIKNLTQFNSFDGRAFCNGKTFRVITDPEVEVEWHDGKPTNKAKAIRLVAQVWHDDTVYVDKDDNPVDVNNLDYEVTCKIKLPDDLMGKSSEDETVQQFVVDCPLHKDDIFEVKKASYFYSNQFGLSITFNDKHGFNWLSHFTR